MEKKKEVRRGGRVKVLDKKNRKNREVQLRKEKRAACSSMKNNKSRL